MQWLRRHRRTSAWSVLLLFALVVSTPTVARGTAFVQGKIAPWTTLCTSGDRAGTDSPADRLHQLAVHCPACHLQTDHLLRPPPADASLAPVPVVARAPCRNALTPPAGPAWGLAQPRAPPRTA